MKAKGRVSKLLWGSGFGRNDYDRFLEQLQRLRPGLVVPDPPFIFGNSRGGPETVREGIARLSAFIEPHLDDATVLMGHSTGAAGMLAAVAKVAWASPAPLVVIALNPARWTGFRAAGFIRRSQWMQARHVLGRSAGVKAGVGLVLRSGGPFTHNALRNPRLLKRFLDDLGELDVVEYLDEEISARSRRIEIPVRILDTRVDEFFSKSPQPDYESVFANVRRLELPGSSHEAVLLEPERVARFVDEVIDEVLSA